MYHDFPRKRLHSKEFLIFIITPSLILCVCKCEYYILHIKGSLQVTLEKMDGMISIKVFIKTDKMFANYMDIKISNFSN